MARTDSERPGARHPYSKPRITDYGQLSALTRGSLVTKKDAGVGFQKPKP
jgi:hypothetical protein